MDPETSKSKKKSKAKKSGVSRRSKKKKTRPDSSPNLNSNLNSSLDSSSSSSSSSSSGSKQIREEKVERIMGLKVVRVSDLPPGPIGPDGKPTLLTKQIPPGRSVSEVIPMRFENAFQEEIYKDLIKNKTLFPDAPSEPGRVWCTKCKLHGVLRPAHKGERQCDRCRRNKCIIKGCSEKPWPKLFTCEQHSRTVLCSQKWKLETSGLALCTSNIYTAKYMFCSRCFMKFKLYEHVLITEEIENQRTGMAQHFKRTIRDPKKAEKAYFAWEKRFLDQYFAEMEADKDSDSDSEDEDVEGFCE